MPFAIVPETGSGRRLDPFLPLGAEQPGWSAIRLKDQDGGVRRLMWTPQQITDSRAIQIGEDKTETLRTPTRNAIRSALKLTEVTGTRLADMIADALMIPPVGGWRPLRPTRRGLWRVYLGPKPDRVLWQAPPIAGGVSIADTFDRANGNLDGSTSSDGQFTWDEFVGTGWTVAGNVAQLADDNADNYARAQIDLGTDDHWSQVILNAFTGSGASFIDLGPFVRKDDGATFTCYYGNADHNGGTPQYRLSEITGGSFATLGTDVQDPAATDVIRTEADGSTIRVLVDSVELISVTDTSITGNLRVGIGGFSMVSGNDGSLNDFSAQDIAAAGAVFVPIVGRGARPGMRLAGVGGGLVG